MGNFKVLVSDILQLIDGNAKFGCSGKEGDFYIGRTEYDSPEVDNEVIIDPEGKKLRIGQFYPVIVSKADFFDLFGKISQI